MYENGVGKHFVFYKEILIKLEIQKEVSEMQMWNKY